MVECEVQKDPGWRGQYYCSSCCVWFRDDDGETPELCPVGEARRDAAVQLREEAQQVEELTLQIEELRGPVLDRLKEIHSAFLHQHGQLLCPGCWRDIDRLRALKEALLKDPPIPFG